MTHRQIAKVRTELRHAGNVADLRQLKIQISTQLKSDIEVYEGEQKSEARNFRRMLEQWWTQAVPSDITPFRIENDVHRAVLYLIVACFTGLGEVGLASWIFDHWKVRWWYGAIAAVIITAVLHGVFHFLVYHEDRPKKSVFIVRRYVVWPAFILFLVAFALSVLPRYLYDSSLIVALLPTLSIGLWIGTLSLSVLAAGLFTIGHILHWSARSYSEYRYIDDLKRANANFLEELSSGHKHEGGKNTEETFNDKLVEETNVH